MIDISISVDIIEELVIMHEQMLELAEKLMNTYVYEYICL